MVAVAALVACSGTTEEREAEGLARPTRVAGIPVLDGYTAGPGTDLHGGLVVPGGALLLGEALPELFGDGDMLDGQWWAGLIVTGPPSEVATDLSDQLTRLGYTVEVPCRPPPAQAGNATGVQCWLLATGSDHREVRAVIDRRPGGPTEAVPTGVPPWSHLTITWGVNPEPGAAIDTGVPPTQPRGEGADIPVPDDWPALPRPGQRLIPLPPHPYEDEVALRVVDGSRPIGPEFPHSEPRRFIMVITGDPSEVLDAYAQQVLRAFGPVASPRPRAPVTRSGYRIETRYIDIEADGYFAATAITNQEDRSYLIIDRLHT